MTFLSVSLSLHTFCEGVSVDTFYVQFVHKINTFVIKEN